ncbi:MAG: helix-turn-helix transcriptional regulator [Cyclobacteriaceae bacterium]
MKHKPEEYASVAISEILDSVTPQESDKVEKRMALAMKIADAMKAKGWKKKDLKEAMGQRNQSVVTKWLSGTHNFTIDTLMDLEDVLDIYLLDLEKKEEPIVNLVQINVEQVVDIVHPISNIQMIIDNSRSLGSSSAHIPISYGPIAEA